MNSARQRSETRLKQNRSGEGHKKRAVFLARNKSLKEMACKATKT